MPISRISDLIKKGDHRNHHVLRCGVQVGGEPRTNCALRSKEGAVGRHRFIEEELRTYLMGLSETDQRPTKVRINRTAT